MTLVLKHSLDSVAILQQLHVRGPSGKEPDSSLKPIKNGIVLACKSSPDLKRFEIFDDCASASDFQVKVVLAKLARFRYACTVPRRFNIYWQAV